MGHIEYPAVLWRLWWNCSCQLEVKLDVKTWGFLTRQAEMFYFGGTFPHDPFWTLNGSCEELDTVFNVSLCWLKSCFRRFSARESSEIAKRPTNQCPVVWSSSCDSCETVCFWLSPVLGLRNMRLVIGSFAHRNLPDISGYGGATRGDSDCCCCCCRLRELCLPIAAMVYVFPVRHPGGCNGDPGLHQSAALRSFQKMRGVAWLGTLTWSCERLSNE